MCNHLLTRKLVPAHLVLTSFLIGGRGELSLQRRSPGEPRVGGFSAFLSLSVRPLLGVGMAAFVDLETSVAGGGDSVCTGVFMFGESDT